MWNAVTKGLSEPTEFDRMFMMPPVLYGQTAFFALKNNKSSRVILRKEKRRKIYSKEELLKRAGESPGKREGNKFQNLELENM